MFIERIVNSYLDIRIIWTTCDIIIININHFNGRIDRETGLLPRHTRAAAEVFKNIHIPK